MPIDYNDYPSNWKTEIRPRILERANNCCERCGVRNHAWIVRKPASADYLYYDENADCMYTYPNGTRIRLSELPDGYNYDKPVRVVLTIHHIGVDYPDGMPGNPHDKMDCRPENLTALCQRCHLKADMTTHIENAKITRSKQKREHIISTGQLVLF